MKISVTGTFELAIGDKKAQLTKEELELLRNEIDKIIGEKVNILPNSIFQDPPREIFPKYPNSEPSWPKRKPLQTEIWMDDTKHTDINVSM